MNGAVIAALGRTPIGRARKGSLVDVRPDDLASYVVTKVLDKLPQLERSEIEDLICGCGLPGGEQGHNIGRVVSILSRLDVAGVGQPLLLVVADDHPDGGARHRGRRGRG